MMITIRINSIAFVLSAAAAVALYGSFGRHIEPKILIGVALSTLFVVRTYDFFNDLPSFKRKSENKDKGKENKKNG